MESFSKSLAGYKGRIDAMVSGGFLRGWLSRYIRGEGAGECIDLISRYCEGGKRLRAWLVGFGYEMVAGKIDDRIMLPSLACELFQTGVLAQDDVFDRSPVRRYGPSMYMALGGTRAAESRTVCAGDIAILLSNALVSNSGFEPGLVARALDFQNSAFVSTMLGEMKDIEIGAAPDFDEAAVLAVARLKTSFYTITGPLGLGAILAGAPDGLVARIGDFGSDLGVSFQIRDDIIGMFGDEDVIGKSALSDAREGKKTLLSCHFAQSAAPAGLEFFRGAYGSENMTLADLQTLRGYMADAGSLAYAEDQCRRYADKARATLAGMGLPAPCAQILGEFMDYLVGRRA